jgi:hypothetical protein
VCEPVTKDMNARAGLANVVIACRANGCVGGWVGGWVGGGGGGGGGGGSGGGGSGGSCGGGCGSGDIGGSNEGARTPLRSRIDPGRNPVCLGAALASPDAPASARVSRSRLRFASRESTISPGFGKMASTHLRADHGTSSPPASATRQ